MNAPLCRFHSTPMTELPPLPNLVGKRIRAAAKHERQRFNGYRRYRCAQAECTWVEAVPVEGPPRDKARKH